MNLEQLLNTLGVESSKAALESKPDSPLTVFLKLAVDDIVKDLRDSLNKYGASTPNGNLEQSITPTKASVKGSEVSLEIEAPFYWKFVNYGVNGTLINRGAPNWGSQSSGGWQEFEAQISNWIVNRGITLPEQFDSYESFNYVIRKGIIEKGKQARPFFSDVVNSTLIRELEKPLTELMGRAITIKIIEPWQ